MKDMKRVLRPAYAIWLIGFCMLHAQQPGDSSNRVNPKFIADVMASIPPQSQTFPLYGNDAIPNSRPAPDEEKAGAWGSIEKVSRPTTQVFLAAKSKANGASVLVFPGGGYVGLSMASEGATVAQFFQDHGIAAFVVKYRLPSDSTMEDKSIGPIQDAQQAIRFVREHAKEWNLDPSRVGAIGFSAGGHLVSTLGTHFDKSYGPNPDQMNLRPDFMILVYPVISMDPTSPTWDRGKLCWEPTQPKSRCGCSQTNSR